MFQQRNFKVALVSLCTLLFAQCPAALAAEPADSQAAVSSTESVEAAQKREIEKFLASFERDWNAHSLDQVMAYYSEDYVNNDGFDKGTIRKLTEELWKTYPDIKSKSTIKQIRIEGPYATISSKDEATGTTADETPGLGSKGELRSQSEGQLYMKHVGMNWHITGDRVDFEKIRISFGQAKQLEPVFAAPEQVKAGKQFSARLEVDMPAGLGATGSISQSTVSFPLPKIVDRYKPIGDPLADHPVLERVMTANTKDRNELLMATVVLTNASGNAIVGVVMLTRRLNIIPAMEEEDGAAKAAAAAKTERKPEEKEPPASGGSVR